MMKRFGIEKSAAYGDIAEIYEELAEQRRMSRRAEAEALLVQVDERIERLRGCDEPQTDKTRALASLWDHAPSWWAPTATRPRST